MKRKILIACSNYWNSPIQVGDQQLARKFVKAGWKVAYISTPISPLHLFKGITPDLKDRFLNYRSGGGWCLDGYLWSYVPGAWVVPQNYAFLKSQWVYNNWHRFTFPQLISLVRRNGFEEVDVVYIRDIKQSFWLDAIQHKMSIYRVADNDSGFPAYNRQAQRLDHIVAKSVDVVIYTANHLKSYAQQMRPKQLFYLPNGVDFSHFNGRLWPVPVEYEKIQKPIAIYIGSIEEWFDFDLIRLAARSLPSVSFVLIGPDKMARQRLIPLPNLHILGRRRYTDIPAYLHHADIGIIPFNVSAYPELVHSINPIKLYEYMACGLPVVAMEWEELKRLGSPAILSKSREEFIQDIKCCLSEKKDKSIYVKYAEEQDWEKRFEHLNVLIHSTIDRSYSTT